MPHFWRLQNVRGIMSEIENILLGLIHLKYIFPNTITHLVLETMGFLSVVPVTFQQKFIQAFLPQEFWPLLQIF